MSGSLTYSLRNAITGSTRLARRAGTYAAIVAATTSTRHAAAIVMASLGTTSKSIELRRDPDTRAMGRPTSGTERHTQTHLGRALRDALGNDTVDADGGQHQRTDCEECDKRRQEPDGRHATALVLSRQPIEVCANFLIEVGIELSSSKQR